MPGHHFLESALAYSFCIRQARKAREQRDLAPDLKVPQIGWNSLDITPGAKLFAGVEEHPYVYFVHSYYLKSKDEADVAARTHYSVEIHASVEKGNVFACQFHPEKSSTVGLKILDNFIHL